MGREGDGIVSTWILIVVTMAYAAGGSQSPSVAIQEFATQRACALAADYVRDQVRIQSKEQSGIITPKFDAKCLLKAVSQ
jgi:hypothetical protein